ncbi:MAG TPA: tetratricopeptide repeat protein, partial [Phycisphaerae bacterium]|nr:tetratricopeptide repeat protein [Phycisphaerae bacterium]
MRHTALVSALVLFATIAGIPQAPADDADPAVKKAEARQHFEKGTLRFDEARYEEAIANFEAAYEITGAPEILYNIGRCHEELGHDRTAVTYYERYLDQQPDAADAAEARERMERLRPAAAAPAEEGKGKEPAAALGGVMLGVTLGAAYPLTGEWDRTMVPFSAVLHFPMTDWLYLTGSVGFGAFAGEEPKTATGYPTGAVDLMVGLTGFKSLNHLFSLFGTLGVGSVFV